MAPEVVAAEEAFLSAESAVAKPSSWAHRSRLATRQLIKAQAAKTSSVLYFLRHPWGELVTVAFGELRTVIWRFLRNNDVMRMTLPYTGCGNLEEPGLAAEFLDSFSSAISHSGS